MGKQNSWLYCSNTTKEHGLSKKHSGCVEKIYDITISEGGKKPPFSSEVALNMDKIELSIAKKDKRNARKTMDMAFGVKRGRSKQFVLCEYRLNYKNPNNIRKSELDSKLLYTKSLLGNEPAVHNNYLFIFLSNIKQQAISKLRRLYSSRPNYMAIDVPELKSRFFKPS